MGTHSNPHFGDPPGVRPKARKALAPQAEKNWDFFDFSLYVLVFVSTLCSDTDPPGVGVQCYSTESIAQGPLGQNKSGPISTLLPLALAFLLTAAKEGV